MAESGAAQILQIRDEFVTCEICLEYFDDQDKSPRILPCFHSFCCRCLESIWEKSPAGVRCPNCRQVWPVQKNIPGTFPQNKVLRNLTEYVNMKSKLDEIMCNECPDSAMATVRCLDCLENMCDRCTTCHKKFVMSKLHRTVLIAEYMNMPQQEFFQQTDICNTHQNLKLDLFCRACSVAVCPSCALISHRDHGILNLKDVYQAKKDQVSAVLCDLEKSKDTSEGYKCKLVEQNEALSVMKQQLIQDVDDSYNKCITILSEKRQQLKEQVISNVAKQQADRNHKLETLTLTNDRKSQHSLYCQQAMLYARAVQFIEMSGDLEKETRRLLEIPQLLDMKMEEVDVDLDTFEQVCKIVKKPAIVVDISKIKPCIEVTDAKKGEESRVVQVTLLPKETKAEDQKEMLKAMIEPATEMKGEEKPKTELISFGVGSVTYRPTCTGPHRCFISLSGQQLTNDGIVFHSRDTDEDVMKKILFGTSESGQYRELLLPTVEFDRKTINRKICSINESGILVNKISATSTSDQTSSLQRFCGVTARTCIPRRGISYWETEVDCMVLESAGLNNAAAAAVGVCMDGHCDDALGIWNNTHAWCVCVFSCPSHNSLCLLVVSRGEALDHSPVTGFKHDTRLTVTLGLLVDSDNATLRVIRVDDNTVLHSVPNIDVSGPLMPMFRVGRLELCNN
ncbi:E3 ubiquitin/ISG15 ligase TRIM25-like isoform X2 [Gigantopelta aegis]|uniref:E3 ubiquitin/ISG15 ligase TRIM25-like isoform X2 n=1 Tax=Gigantopelta aegis TaxID=1735272 RepID=UPI001B889C41|nr:E3 ubiquitin/ISG15 ligase TRIM25-like isoform X2 [Gigantopelta aegis]XP_041356501.1 E3 ubiquitin/ISG15 ligase TRIM25-like isoform X2 [Gigantopelta aegis]